MGHYYAEMVESDETEIRENTKRRAAIENAVKLGVIAGIEAGKNSVGMDRDGMYAKPVRVSAIVKRVLREIF